jgi:hypothetical protein
MTRRVETRLDGDTLVARIPMRFQHRGGRKRIVAPDGTLVKALARAWRWQKLERPLPASWNEQHQLLLSQMFSPADPG